MNDDTRGLGRGLDDLMAQNEIDLPACEEKFMQGALLKNAEKKEN